MSVQINTPMPLVVDTPHRIAMRHSGRGALAFLLACVAGMVAVFRFIPFPTSLFPGGILALFVLILGIFGLYRDALEIDLGSRQWRRRYGFIGRVEQLRGGLDEIPEVALDLERRGAGDDNAPSWEVSITAPRWKSRVVLASSGSEEKGYAALEAWSKRLRLSALDRTGDEPVRSAWDALDAPLRGRAGSGSGVGADTRDPLVAAYGAPPRTPAHPPSGSRILMLRERGRPRLVLPPIGWSSGATFLSLFGAAFGGFGLVAMLVGLQVLFPGVPINGTVPTEPVWGFAAAGAFFALIGGGLIGGMLVGSRARESIEDAGDAIVTAHGWGGMRWHEKTLLKRTSEAIDLSDAPTAETRRWAAKSPKLRPAEPPPRADGQRDVRIRTHAHVVRLARYLPEEEQRWLRDTLLEWTRS